MNKSLLLISVAVYSFMYCEEVSQGRGINVHGLSNRMLTYLNCLRRKATPQERKLAAEFIKKDGPIVLGSSVVLIGGGTIAAVYGKQILNKICNNTKRRNSEPESTHGSAVLEDITNLQKEDAINAVNALCDSIEEKPKRAFMIDGKEVTVTLGKNRTLQLTIDADLEERDTLDLYPYMQSLALYLTQEKNANVDVIITTNSGSKISHFNGEKWLFKDKLITSTAA